MGPRRAKTAKTRRCGGGAWADPFQGGLKRCWIWDPVVERNLDNPTKYTTKYTTFWSILIPFETGWMHFVGLECQKHLSINSPDEQVAFPMQGKRTGCRLIKPLIFLPHLDIRIYIYPQVCTHTYIHIYIRFLFPPLFLPFLFYKVPFLAFFVWRLAPAYFWRGKRFFGSGQNCRTGGI